MKRRTEADCDRLVEMVRAEQRPRRTSQIAVGGQKVPVLERSPRKRVSRPSVGCVDSGASYAVSGVSIKKDTLKPAKKSRKLPTTPRSRVRAALRQLYLRSRERAARLKLAGNSCERCGVKASKAKGREVGVQVHHRKGIAGWEQIIDLIFAELLVDPSLLEAVCVDCHRAEHGKGEPTSRD